MMHVPDHTLHIGSHLFTPRRTPPEEIKRLVQLMNQAGMDMIRIYPYWSEVEGEKGAYDFTAVDAAYRAAEELGMNILHTFKPNSPPQWMRLTRSFNLDDYPDLDDPRVWQPLLDFVTATARRYKDSPALHSWCVWNEPRIRLPEKLSPNARAAFREFLRREYDNDIAALNHLYFNQYGGFDELYADDAGIHPDEFMDYPERMDFLRFRSDMLARKLREMGAAIRAVDHRHPRHANAITFRHNMLDQGGWQWSEAREVDFLGASVYPGWSPDPGHDESTLHGFVCDFIRSATRAPGQLAWITETQGGFSHYTGRNTYSPEPDLLQRWAWEMIGSGVKGILYWTFSPTIRGEWSLLDLDSQPSPRLEAVAEVCRTVEKHRALFDAARPAEPEIWILNSLNSNALDAIRGKDDCPGGGRHAHQTGVYGAWCRLRNAGYEVGFVEEATFADGGAPVGSVVVAPDCSALDEAALRGLAAWVEDGGTLVADGQFAFMDRHGRRNRHMKQTVDALFGARLLDYAEPTERPGDTLPAWGLRAVLENGPSLIHEHRYGKGRAVRINTVLFQRFAEKDFAVPAFMEKLPPPAGNPVLRNGSDRLRLLRLDGDPGFIFLLNYGDKAEAELLFNRSCILEDIDRGETFRCAGGGLTIPLADGEIRKFIRRQE